MNASNAEEPPAGQQKRRYRFSDYVQFAGVFFLVIMVALSALFVASELVLLRKWGWTISLTIALLVPTFFCFFYSALCKFREAKDKKDDAEAAIELRHVAYQAAAFLILALSLRAFGLRDGHGAGDAIAEMASIMILFVLAEFAAFLGRDVHEAGQQLKKLQEAATKAAVTSESASQSVESSITSLKATADKFERLPLFASLSALHPQLLSDAGKLLEQWGQRVPRENESNFADGNLCWKILLHEYIKEELSDIRKFHQDDLESDDIPSSVRPVQGCIANVSDIACFATNVGFYARFLESLVNALPQATKITGHRPCIAIITNVLPAHWWNWPMPDGSWRQYGPIDKYRESMRHAAESGAQVDRIILVEDQLPPLTGGQRASANACFDAKMLDDMMKNWQIWSGPQSVLPCGSTLDSFGEFGSFLKEHLPPEITKENIKGRNFYPISNTPCEKDSLQGAVNIPFHATPLSTKYSELHGPNGSCWRMSIGNDLTPWGHLEDHYDMMFIGVGKGRKGDEGLWTADVKCEWTMCLMSSMSPTSETMFLTVVSGESAKRHHAWCCKRLHGHLNWATDCIVNPKKGPAAGEDGSVST